MGSVPLTAAGTTWRRCCLPGRLSETQCPSFVLGMDCVSAACLPRAKILAPRRRAGVGTVSLGTLHHWGTLVLVDGAASPEPVLQAHLGRTAASGPLHCLFSAHSPCVSGGKSPAGTSDWAHRLAAGRVCLPLFHFWFLSWGMAPAGPGTQAVGIPKHRKWFLMLGSAVFLLPESEPRWGVRLSGVSLCHVAVREKL